MLKNIPSILTPELLKILKEMGHGDEIVISDGNFPAASHTNRLIRCDGHNVPNLLDAILTLFPLDRFVEFPVALMSVGPDDPEPPIWAKYREIIKKHEPVNNGIENEERFAFYDRTKKAYAIVATGETSLYANVILKKGVIE